MKPGVIETGLALFVGGVLLATGAVAQDRAATPGPAAPPGEPALILETLRLPGEIGRAARAPDAPRPPGEVLETRPQINPAQRPAFAEQTRAPYAPTKTPYATRVVATGLTNPWGLAFLPDARMIVTERGGAVRIVGRDGKVGAPLEGAPRVVAYGAAGMLDVVLDPDFRQNRRLYIAYVAPRAPATALTVMRATLSADERRLEDGNIIYEGPVSTNAQHTGGRLLLGPDRKLYLGVGDRFSRENRIKAQSLDARNGKVMRMELDGSVPADNPFKDVAAAEGLIWTYGNRNPQGLAVHPETGDIWESEHGPQAGDEVNILKRGHNYGWPLVAYGAEYDNSPLSGGRTQMPGADQPAYYWDPAVAPSGMAFYTGRLMPEWRGNLFVAALAGQHLSRLVLRGDKVVGEERLLQEQRQRIRTVLQGPDDALWVLTDNAEGRLLRIAPAGR